MNFHLCLIFSLKFCINFSLNLSSFKLIWELFLIIVFIHIYNKIRKPKSDNFTEYHQGPESV